MSGDELVFVAVLLLRLGVPLFIPKFPLPAILASLVLDAADQTIFQNNTNLNLDNYQGYDKALDVYYLTIAYLSTIRNWTDPFTFHVSQFLFYYRMIGVLLFELTDVRALLIIFPNTFEYFFIAYEAIRLWWNPDRLSKKQVIMTAAGIWIFIKLPQEWWLHIAQLDFTDFMKEDVFGVSVETSWGEAISQNLWFVALVAVVVIAVIIAVRHIWPRLPDPDWKFGFNIDRTVSRPEIDPDQVPQRTPILSWYMFEKVALVSIIVAIFSAVLPDTDASALGIITVVGLLIIVNSLASYWLALRGRSWSSTITEFLAMAVINIGTMLVMILVVRGSDSSVNEGATIFFVLLLTLIVTMFDRYHRERAVALPIRGDAAGAG